MTDTATKVAQRAAGTPAKLTAAEALQQTIAVHRDAIAMSLPSGMSAERFGRLLLTAANTNPELFECAPRSFLAAGVMCAQLGLEPNDARGLAYLIPFKDKRRGKIVQVIIGYRGMLELARRSGLVGAVHAFPVYAGDDFSYELGLHPTIHHRPGEHDEDPSKITHVYAVADLSGSAQFVVLTRKQVDKARAASRGSSSDYSPWTTNYTEMAVKTAIRRLAKWLPQSVEMARALAQEERPLTLGDLGDVVAEDGGHLDTDDDDTVDVGEAQIHDATATPAP